MLLLWEFSEHMDLLVYSEGSFHGVVANVLDCDIGIAP